jgi:hypothetical protein
MDVMLWILIGLAGGLAVAALAPEMGLPTRATAARRHVRGMACGLVGAVATGYALVLVDPALGFDRLTAGLGALAGALWFAGIAEAYASRRRRGEGSVLSAPASDDRLSAREIPAYDAALAADLALDRDSAVPSSSPAPTAPHQALVVRERRLVGTRLSDAFAESQ